MLKADPLYKDIHAPLEDRVNDLLSQLTLDEKLTLLVGTDFTTQPIPRLGIPALRMCDAGEGVRGGGPIMDGPATQFPASVTMASSWDREMLARIGKAIGEELLNKAVGGNVLLGPGINIHRSPLGGRNGEYFSEDPYLTSRLAVTYIQGMQSSGALACAKHYVCNNQEEFRSEVDAEVSERALREIYLPAFEASVKEGHVATVMASYNLINGFHATANHYLLTDVLKKGWGFDGMVMSDWGAVHEVGTIAAGNDLEMPHPKTPKLPALHQALEDGIITQAQVDDSVRRILRTIFRAKLMDGPPHVPDHSLVASAEHLKLAWAAATEGIVLLKNERGALPLQADKIKTLAIIGPGLTNAHTGMEGSAHVTPSYIETLLNAVLKRAPGNISVISSPGFPACAVVPSDAFYQDADKKTPGLKAEYFADRTFGKPLLVRTDHLIDCTSEAKDSLTDRTSPLFVPGPPQADYAVRWTGYIVAPETGHYLFRFTANNSARVTFDGQRRVGPNDGMDTNAKMFAVDLQAGQGYSFQTEYVLGKGAPNVRLEWATPSMSAFSDAVETAKKADVVIAWVSTMASEREGHDRPSMDLPEDQNDLIGALAAVNKNVIVVLNNGTPVTMPWLDQVPAVVEAWLPGMEGANAITSILFGDVNPSGKLPDTFGVRREDYPDFGNFPSSSAALANKYAEGIYVGYRHFDQARIEPLFPFGFGLSYTTFAYRNLKLSQSEVDPTDKITATVDIQNTGSRAGAEVAELYVHDPAPKIDKPVRELKGFARVALAPGETKTVSFDLPMRALAYCDVPGKQWKADAGTYDVELGASSRDIKLTAPVQLTSDYTEAIPLMDDQFADASNDLALKATTTASSTQTGYPASNATDGDDNTRWGSDFSDPQWLQVDLGAPKTFRRIQILWEDASARAYSLETSNDGTAWSKVYETATSTGGWQNLRFDPVTARYVRLYGTKRNTPYGYSIFSLRVLPN